MWRCSFISPVGHHDSDNVAVVAIDSKTIPKCFTCFALGLISLRANFWLHNANLRPRNTQTSIASNRLYYPLYCVAGSMNLIKPPDRKFRNYHIPTSKCAEETPTTELLQRWTVLHWASNSHLEFEDCSMSKTECRCFNGSMWHA